MKLQRLIESEETRWSETQLHPYSQIFRTGILRDLSRSIHAERSRFLSEQTDSELPSLEKLESAMDSLLNVDLSDARLDSILNQSAQKLAPLPSVLPNELKAAIPADKLDRFDRKWERRIAELAALSKWTFWTLDAWIQIFHAEKFHKAIAQALWLKGLVLFVESVPEARLDATAVPIWKGRWFTVFSPNEANSGPEILTSLPGLSMEPDQPRWTRIFPR